MRRGSQRECMRITGAETTCSRARFRCVSAERGSALLIVFVFAAVVAIMLYMEMPVAVFESQRQKEQLLVDRGNEYAHAVKLFVRKVGRYPASLDQLEDTNRMRFLRHRFKDPFTGKDDWRLLHAGPNGVLIDSKVKPLNPVAQNGTNGNPTPGFGSTSGNSGFGSANSPGNSNSNNSSNSSFGSSSSFSNGGAFGNSGGFASSSGSDGTEKVVQPIPQRPPAIAANGSGQPATNPQDDPMAPLMPPDPSVQASAAQNQSNPSTNSSINAPANPSANPQPGSPDGHQVQIGGPPGATPAGAGQPGTAGTNPSNATQAVGALMTNPNPATGQTNATGTAFAATTGRTGVLNSGGIAGVASIAKGHSIKVINDQEDYSLWEFYYDPSKDSTSRLRNAQAALQRQVQGQNQSQGQNSNSSCSFFQNSTTTPDQGSSTPNERAFDSAKYADGPP